MFPTLTGTAETGTGGGAGGFAFGFENRWIRSHAARATPTRAIVMKTQCLLTFERVCEPCFSSFFGPALDSCSFIGFR